MCHVSFGLVARTPILGFAGCRRSLGLRHPRSHTSRRQVVGEANTRPMRWARIASVPVGTCRYRGEVTISRIASVSSTVSRCGEMLGHDEWSSRSHAVSARFQPWYRETDRPRRRRIVGSLSVRWARSKARRTPDFASPSGRRRLARSTSKAPRRATRSRTTARSLWTRRRKRMTSDWRSCASLDSTSMVTVVRAGCRSQPVAVDRGTPRRVASVTSRVRRTWSRSLWS